ncbi:MAG: hypothetical protein ACFFCK_09915 [Promethearchaeota archaeon]
MTEIPLPSGYQESPKPSSGIGLGWKVIAGLVVAVVVVAGVAVVLFRSIDSNSGGEREIGSWDNVDIELYPGVIYRNEFSVSSSEAQGSLLPDLHFDISVDNTGSDSVSVEINIAVYELNVTNFDSLSSSGRAPYLVEEATSTNSYVKAFLLWIHLAELYPSMRSSEGNL